MLFTNSHLLPDYANNVSVTSVSTDLNWAVFCSCVRPITELTELHRHTGIVAMSKETAMKGGIHNSDVSHRSILLTNDRSAKVDEGTQMASKLFKIKTSCCLKADSQTTSELCWLSLMPCSSVSITASAIQCDDIMVKDAATNVLPLAVYIQEADDLLTLWQTHPQTVVLWCLSWKAIRNSTTRHKFPSPPDVKHFMAVNLLSTSDASRPCSWLPVRLAVRKMQWCEYFEVGNTIRKCSRCLKFCLAMKHIQTEMKAILATYSSMPASEQLRKEPTARLQTVNSKVAMHANDTINTLRNSPCSANGKLQWDGATRGLRENINY